MDESEVLLHVYEVSNGLARTFSPMFLGGKQINGIWHTGIVVYNVEFFFGSMGIESCKKGEFYFKPDNVISLGKTQIPYDVLMDHLQELGSTTFRGSCYHLFNHNCNTFSNELAMFLTGKTIPSEITDLPKEIENTPIGTMIKQFVNSMHEPFSAHSELEQDNGARHIVNSVAEMRNLSFDEPLAKSVSSSLSSSSNLTSSGAADFSKNPEQVSSNPNSSADSRKACFQKETENIPPVVVYNDKAVLNTFGERRSILHGLLQPNELQSLEEVFEYLSLNALDWSLSRDHLSLMCRLVTDASVGDEICTIAGQLLLLSLSHSDFRSVCVHDSTQNLLNLIHKYDQLPLELLTILSKCLCNFVGEIQVVEWLLKSNGGMGSSSVESSVALCAHCLLSEHNDLVEVGCGIASAFLRSGMISEDVALRFGVAIVELVCCKSYSDKSENLLWFSFCECMKLNHQVVELAKTMGLDLNAEEQKRPSIVKHTQRIRHLFKCD